MKAILAASLSIWLAMNSGLAIAAEVSGVIDSLDWTTRQLIVDGRSYFVQRGINMARFKAGDKVKLNFEKHNGKGLVTKLNLATPSGKRHADSPSRG